MLGHQKHQYPRTFPHKWLEPWSFSQGNKLTLEEGIKDAFTIFLLQMMMVFCRKLSFHGLSIFHPELHTRNSTRSSGPQQSCGVREFTTATGSFETSFNSQCLQSGKTKMFVLPDWRRRDPKLVSNLPVSRKPTHTTRPLETRRPSWAAV